MNILLAAALLASLSVVSSKPPCRLYNLAHHSGRWVPANLPPAGFGDCARTIRRLDNQAMWCDGRVQNHSLRQQAWVPNHCVLSDDHTLLTLFDSIRDTHVVFLGDSITRQHYNNLACFAEAQMSALADSGQMTRKQVHETFELRKQQIISFEHNAMIEMIDTTTMFDIIAGSPPTLGDPDVAWVSVLRGKRVPLTKHDSSSESSTSTPSDDPVHRLAYQRWRRVVVILNSGAHWSKATFLRHKYCDQHMTIGQLNALYYQAMRSVFSRFARYKGDAQSMTLVFRGSSPGHKRCAMNKTQPKSFLWSEFSARNERIRQLIEEYGSGAVEQVRMVYLDVWNISLRRTDAHPGSRGVHINGDCYHWCSPSKYSVLNVWTQATLQLLRELAE